MCNLTLDSQILIDRNVCFTQVAKNTAKIDKNKKEGAVGYMDQ